MSHLLHLVPALLLGISASVVTMPQAPPAPPGPIAHIAAIGDVTIECDAAGNWVRIYSTGTQAVESSDRRKLSEAENVAAERAVAQITRFFEQDASNLPH